MCKCDWYERTFAPFCHTGNQLDFIPKHKHKITQKDYFHFSADD